MDNTKRTDLLLSSFDKRYSQPPSIFAQAPGRVDLMGSHTDYNQGYVLTQAINRETWIAASPRWDHKVNIQSLNIDPALRSLFE